jgi:hypothetical protein
MQSQFNVIDAKTSALITHISIIIAALMAYVGFALQGNPTKLSFVDVAALCEIPAYILILIGCLDCINILGPVRFVTDRPSNVGVLLHEMYRRRETYRFCRRAVMTLTLFLLGLFCIKVGAVIWNSDVVKL